MPQTTCVSALACSRQRKGAQASVRTRVHVCSCPTHHCFEVSRLSPAPHGALRAAPPRRRPCVPARRAPSAPAGHETVRHCTCNETRTTPAGRRRRRASSAACSCGAHPEDARYIHRKGVALRLRCDGALLRSSERSSERPRPRTQLRNRRREWRRVSNVKRRRLSVQRSASVPLQPQQRARRCPWAPPSRRTSRARPPPPSPAHQARARRPCAAGGRWSGGAKCPSKCGTPLPPPELCRRSALCRRCAPARRAAPPRRRVPPRPLRCGRRRQPASMQLASSAWAPHRCGAAPAERRRVAAGACCALRRATWSCQASWQCE